MQGIILNTNITNSNYNANISWNFNFKIDNIEDNARQILNVNPLYYDDNKIWWRWDKIRWIQVLTCDIIEFVKKAFNAYGLSSSTSRTSLLNALMDESRSRKPKIPPSTWVQLGTKIYDISNDNVIDPNPKYFIKNVIPIEIGDTEDTPIIEKTFKEWLDNRYDILYDIIAMTMSSDYFIDIFFFLVGSGSNGKGIFTTIINDFIGDENTVDQNIEQLSDPRQRFQTGDLKDKLLCNLGDGNFGVLKQTKLLKELAGKKDKVKCELKGSNNKSYFYNKATILGSFNTLPQTMDKTIGFYRRCHITEFKKQFNGEKDLDVVMFRPEYPNLALKCLNRLKEIYKKRDIKGWGTIDERKAKYDILSDLIKQFMNAEMIEDHRGCFTKTLFHKEYEKWAFNNGRNELDFKDCISRLEARGIDYHRKTVYITEKGYVYGRLEDIPEDLKVLDKNNEFLLLSSIRIQLFNGYFFNKQTKKHSK